MNDIASKKALDAARVKLKSVLHEDGPELWAILERSHTAGLRGTFLVGAGLLTNAGAMFLLWDSVERPEYAFPYRALMSQGVKSLGSALPMWSIDSIESMCPSCFGTGMLDGEHRPCDTCGAVGWGLREVFATDQPELGDAGRGQTMESAAMRG